MRTDANYRRQDFGYAVLPDWGPPRRINWYRVGALLLNCAAWACLVAIVIGGLAISGGN